MVKLILPSLENYPLESFNVSTTGITDILLSDRNDEGDGILTFSNFLLSRCKPLKMFE